ncbi:hypothetical protein HYQ46_006324 [Verticillium longisporum]|nr:hypothetical protein HYQ46_006324 [Verticillium longisporum]
MPASRTVSCHRWIDASRMLVVVVVFFSRRGGKRRAALVPVGGGRFKGHGPHGMPPADSRGGPGEMGVHSLC